MRNELHLTRKAGSLLPMSIDCGRGLPRAKRRPAPRITLESTRPDSVRNSLRKSSIQKILVPQLAAPCKRIFLAQLATAQTLLKNDSRQAEAFQSTFFT